MPSTVTTENNSVHRAAIQRLRERTHLPDTEAPYHGASHPKLVWSHAELLCDRCDRAGIPVNRHALHDAVELHDSLCHINPQLLGFSSSENLASTLAFNFLRSSGYSEEAAAFVSNIVMATHPDVRPITPEQIIIRAADLWNVGGPHSEFMSANLALFKEMQLARGAEVPFEKWLQGSYQFLSQFLWPFLELTPEARDSAGRSVWHTQAMSNLSRTWRNTFRESARVVAEFSSSGTIASHGIEPHTLYIGLDPDEERRRATLCDVAAVANESKSVVFVIPGSKTGFSLPDELCDTVIVHEPNLDVVCEAIRVTADGGTIVAKFSDTLDVDVVAIARSLHNDVIDRRSEGKGCSLVILKRPFL
jgi:hypothetical protein